VPVLVFILYLPKRLKLFEINLPALGNIFNLNSSLNRGCNGIQSTKLYDADSI